MVGVDRIELPNLTLPGRALCLAELHPDLVARPGLEPRLTGSKPAVLPLHYPTKRGVGGVPMSTSTRGIEWFYLATSKHPANEGGCAGHRTPRG